MKILRVGLAGFAGAGKNTAADILTAEFGFRQTSFAEPLREEVARITVYKQRIPVDLIERAADGDVALQELASSLLRARDMAWPIIVEGEIIDQTGMDPWAKPTHALMRKILQLWGTEYRRVADPDYWTRKINLSQGDRLVVTDVRYPNERALFDELWYVRNTSQPLTLATSHTSEGGINPGMCQHTITHNGADLDELRCEVRKAVSSRLHLPAPLLAAI